MNIVRIPASEGVLARGTAIMRVLCESDEHVSISEISAALGVTPSSVHRLLDDLVRARWVERTVNHRYRVAFEFYRLGALSSHRITPVELARPLLSELAARCDETALFAMRVPGAQQMVFAEQADASHPLRYRLPRHLPRSLVWGAPARAILAWLPESDQREALANAAASPKRRKPPAWPAWAREAAQIRERGYVTSHGQISDWAVGYAAPVFGVSGVVGALTFVVPEVRAPASSERRFVSALQEAAARLSRSLGAQAGASGAAPEDLRRMAHG